MAITVTEPTATRDSNLSYYVASDNPIIFTFTANAGETQAQLQIYDDTTGTGVLINSFDIVLSFDASNEIDFDVSPYLRSLISNINDFNYTSDSSADTNASIKFYIDYAEFDPSPSYTSTNTFTAVKSAKQIGDTYGANLAEFVDFTTQASLQELNTPSKTLPYWLNYPFSLEGITNQEVGAFVLAEYLYSALIVSTTTVLTPNQLINHFNISPSLNDITKLNFYLDDYKILDFTINTANLSTGSSAINQFQLPLISTGSYNFFIDWGDGTSNDITAWDQAETIHTYSIAGVYNITILGTLEGWQFANTGDKLKILDIAKWGSLVINNNTAFDGCTNLTLSFVDKAFFSGSINACFRNTTFPNGISNANLSNVTSIVGLFFGNTSFNESLNSWDVSNVLNMLNCFYQCSSFNSDLSGWNTESCATFGFMFFECVVFSQPLNSWNTSSGTRFENMFNGCSAFNQPLNSWDTSAAINMSYMFFECVVFNQDLSSWNTAKVTSMNRMFADATLFNQDLSSWSISALLDAELMFLGTSFSTANYDLLLDINTGWAGQGGIQMNVPLGVNSTSYTKTETFTGTNTSANTNQLIDTGTDFTTATAVVVGDAVYNSSTGAYALVSGISNAASGILDLNADIFTGTPENYGIRTSNAAKGKATLISVYGWTITDLGGI